MPRSRWTSSVPWKSGSQNRMSVLWRIFKVSSFPKVFSNTRSLEKCGIIASDFYEDMQRVVFEPEFPVICEVGNETSIGLEQSKTDTNMFLEPLTSTANSILIESPVASPVVTTTVQTTVSTLPASYFNQSYPVKSTHFLHFLFILGKEICRNGPSFWGCEHKHSEEYSLDKESLPQEVPV